MNCNQAREHLSAHLEGELDGALSVAFKDHLGECRECSRAAGEMTHVWARLGNLETIEPPAELHEKIMGRLAALHDKKQTAAPRVSFWDAWLGRTPPVRRWATVGATALLLALLGSAPFFPAGHWVAARIWPGFQSSIPASPQDAIAIRVSPRPIEGSMSTLSIDISPGRDVAEARVVARVAPGVNDFTREVQEFSWKQNLRRGEYSSMSMQLDFPTAGMKTVRIDVTGNDGRYRAEKMAFIPIRGIDQAKVKAGSVPITLEARDMDIYQALALLSATTKTPIIADTDLHGRVNVSLDNDRLVTALDKVLSPLGYTWNAAGGLYIIRNQPVEGEPRR